MQRSEGGLYSGKLGVHLDTYHMNMEEQDWKKPVLRGRNHIRELMGNM